MYFIIKTIIFCGIILLVFGVIPPQAGETVLTNLTFLLVVMMSIDITETKEKVDAIRKGTLATVTHLARGGRA